MFTTARAHDMRKKLLYMNPKWAGDDNLILKAYLSHKIRAKIRNYSDDDLKDLGNYVLEPFFKDGSEAEKTSVDNIRNTFRTCRTIEQFIMRKDIERPRRKRIHQKAGQGKKHILLFEPTVKDPNPEELPKPTRHISLSSSV